MKKKVYPLCEICGKVDGMRLEIGEGCKIEYYNKCYDCFNAHTEDLLKRSQALIDRLSEP